MGWILVAATCTRILFFRPPFSLWTYGNYDWCGSKETYRWLKDLLREENTFVWLTFWLPSPPQPVDAAQRQDWLIICQQLSLSTRTELLLPDWDIWQLICNSGN